MKRTRLAALALAVGLACVGCTADDPEPEFSPPESTSPTPTETETASGPPEPKKLNPEETVRAWVEARNQALRTGIADDVRALSTNDCTSCEDLISPIEEIYAAGGQFKTKGWRIAGLNVEKLNKRRADVQVALDIAGGRTIERAGAEPVKYPPEKRIAVFELSARDGGWAVSLLGYLS